MKTKELEIVGELSEEDLGYEFNIFRVVRNGAGELFYAQDCGCSCPEPFEDYRSEADYTRLTNAPDSISAFKASLKSWGGVGPAEISGFEDKILAML